LAPESNETAGQEAVDKTTLFHHIATTYHENKPTPLHVIQPPQPSSLSHSGGFLASMLQVEVTDVAPMNAQSPDKKFTDELRVYMRFEGGHSDMLNPLDWWRVRSYFPR
jgi:hypothetical protein